MKENLSNVISKTKPERPSVQQVVSSAGAKLTQFRRMRSFLNEKAALLVYKNMLLQVLEYGDILLTGTKLDNKKKLQILQNKGLRCALNRDKFTGSIELHREAKLLKLKYRREQHLLNFMFDKSLVQRNSKQNKLVGVSTRSKSKKLLKVKRPKTEKFKNSLSYRGQQKWTALSEEVQKAPTKCIFKALFAVKIKERAEKEVT